MRSVPIDGTTFLCRGAQDIAPLEFPHLLQMQGPALLAWDPGQGRLQQVRYSSLRDHRYGVQDDPMN
jgi:hypothetical protein